MPSRVVIAMLLPAAAPTAPSFPPPALPGDAPAHAPAGRPDAAFAGPDAVVVYRGPDGSGLARGHGRRPRSRWWRARTVCS